MSIETKKQDPFMHEWEPDFSEGEPPVTSKTCGICGREDNLYHIKKSEVIATEEKQ